MAVDAVPARIRWAVDLLDVRPADRLLEIGCGGGVAAALICPLLDTGHVTAIDRSATAIGRARRRNAGHLAAGRATIETAAFRAADLAAAGLTGRSYDKIFAIDVNLFWTGPARAELALARDLLAPGGALYLCYHPPGDRHAEIAGKVTATLAAGGFDTETAGGVELGIVGRPRARPDARAG